MNRSQSRSESIRSTNAQPECVPTSAGAQKCNGPTPTGSVGRSSGASRPNSGTPDHQPRLLNQEPGLFTQAAGRFSQLLGRLIHEDGRFNQPPPLLLIHPPLPPPRRLSHEPLAFASGTQMPPIAASTAAADHLPEPIKNLLRSIDDCSSGEGRASLGSDIVMLFFGGFFAWIGGEMKSRKLPTPTGFCHGKRYVQRVRKFFSILLSFHDPGSH